MSADMCATICTYLQEIHICESEHLQFEILIRINFWSHTWLIIDNGGTISLCIIEKEWQFVFKIIIEELKEALATILTKKNMF